MKGYEPSMSFNEGVARRDLSYQRGDEQAAVAFLSQLAREGPVLELGIGTGRIAVPLAAQGLRVDGIDISAPMLEQLRSRPGGEALQVTLGDFADVPIDGSYRLVFVVFNTFHNLLTQEDQVRCFENVAAHLEGGGFFLIEALSPAFLYKLRNNQYVDAEAIAVDEVHLDLLRHYPERQIIEESHVSLSQAGIRMNPVVQRYAWPSELDLMARIAGLRLEGRWGGWHKEPFTGSSERHISVYVR